MTKEIWKVIPGFPEYQASSEGRLVSYRRKKPHYMLGELREAKGKISRHVRDELVSPEGRPVKFLRHRLIIWVFTGIKPNKGEVVYHINGNGYDNRVENLAIRKKECPKALQFGHTYYRAVRHVAEKNNGDWRDFMKFLSDRIEDIYEIYLIERKLKEIA